MEGSGPIRAASRCGICGLLVPSSASLCNPGCTSCRAFQRDELTRHGMAVSGEDAGNIWANNRVRRKFRKESPFAAGGYVHCDFPYGCEHAHNLYRSRRRPRDGQWKRRVPEDRHMQATGQRNAYDDAGCRCDGQR